MVVLAPNAVIAQFKKEASQRITKARFTMLLATALNWAKISSAEHYADLSAEDTERLEPIEKFITATLRPLQSAGWQINNANLSS